MPGDTGDYDLPLGSGVALQLVGDKRTRYSTLLLASSRRSERQLAIGEGPRPITLAEHVSRSAGGGSDDFFKDRLGYFGDRFGLVFRLIVMLRQDYLDQTGDNGC
jgi:hypothetical protein